MGPRSTLGAGRRWIAIWPAIVVLASGAAPVSARSVDGGGQTAVRMDATAFEQPRQFELRPPCPVITISPDSPCPLPAIPTQSSTKRATIYLCSESLCGKDFYPGDVILLLANRPEGSTFWRTVADRSGNFRSALPAPLCRFAPIGLTAFDTHADRSARLWLASRGCERATP